MINKMKTPERWRPSRVVPSLSLFLPERPFNRQTDGAENITSTAYAGGNNLAQQKYIDLIPVLG